MSLSHRLFAVLSAATLVAMTAFPLSAAPLRGPVILTISGNIANPSRGAMNPAQDKFFAYNDVEFESAAQFDFAALQSLGFVSITADFPMDGPVYTFEGPLLVDVLDAAGARGDTITIRALDGFLVDLDIAAAVANGAVVAMKRDGVPFALGDFGPTQVVFPRAERADLAGMNDDTWIYSIYHINVE